MKYLIVSSILSVYLGGCWPPAEGEPGRQEQAAGRVPGPRAAGVPALDRDPEAAAAGAGQAESGARGPGL